MSPGWQPFPTSELPKIVREYVLELAERFEVDPVTAALPALVAVAGCLGKARVVRIDPQWVEPAALFGCQVKGNSVADVAVIHWAIGTAPGVVFGDLSAANLIADLVESPRGVLYFCEELGAALRRHRASGPDLAFLLNAAWRGGYYLRPSADPAKPSGQIERAMLSLYGLMSEADFCGIAGVRSPLPLLFANRFLVAMPPRRNGRYDPAGPREEVLRPYADLLRRLSELDEEACVRPDWAPLETPMSAAAQKRFHEWAEGRRAQILQADGELAPTLCKQEGYCIRLALCLAACEYGAALQLEQMAVEEADVARAVLITNWFAAEARRLQRVRSDINQHALPQGAGEGGAP